MTESEHETLLDNLLKSRYPLTYFLSRQQKFCFVESESNVTGKRNIPHPSHLNKTEAIDRQAPEFYDSRNGINITQGSDDDDDENTIQEYDARPISKKE